MVRQGAEASDRSLQPGVVHEPPGPPRAFEDAPDPDIQLPEDVPGRHRVPPGVGEGFRGDLLQGAAQEPAESGPHIGAPLIAEFLGEFEPEELAHAVRQ